jgi:hypothetical protein
MGSMSELDGGQLPDGGDLPGGGNLAGFGDPADALKKKSLPWPVYLAIGLAILAAGAFVGFRSYQNRQKVKLHIAFMEGYQEFEKTQVGAFWKCLFGKDGDGRRFNAPEALNATLEGQLFGDPKTYPEKVNSDCVPKAIKASKGIKELNPPPEYEEALDKYGKSLAALANTLQVWTEGAPKRVETMEKEAKLKSAGETWSTTANVNKADPAAWQYDKFLHCAVPDIDKLKDSQALLELIATKCIQKKGQEIDQAFLAKLRDTCIPEAQEAPAKQPPTFKGTFNKFAADYDRMTQAWGSCFRKMKKESKKDDLAQFDQAWADWINGSSTVRTVAVKALCDAGDDKSCEAMQRQEDSKKNPAAAKPAAKKH